MPVKITVSYTSDCERIAEQIEPRLKDILPPYKLKKDIPKPPYKLSPSPGPGLQPRSGPCRCAGASIALLPFSKPPRKKKNGGERHFAAHHQIVI